jgi:hypothetical protein
MRGIKHLCRHCKTKFIPRRRDAEFCSNLCRQAAYYKRGAKKRNAAAALAHQELEAEWREDGLDAIAEFQRYQSLAAMLHQRARDEGHKISCMATKIGLLATAKTLDDLYGSPILSWIPRHLYECQKTTSRERELQALLSISSGGSYLAHEAERDCRKIIESQSPVPVLVFVDRRDEPRDDDTIENSDTSRWPELDNFVSRDDSFDDPSVDIAEDRDDCPDDHILDDGDLADGFEVFDVFKKTAPFEDEEPG